MNQYFATFVSGAQAIVKEALQEKFPDLRVDFLLDGLITFQTSAPPEKIKSLRFFNNSFLLIKNFPHPNLALVFNELVKNDELKNFLYHQHYPKNMGYQIIVAKEGQVISVSPSLLYPVKQIFSKFLLKRPNKSKKSLEFWLFLRREKLTFFGQRLSANNPSKNPGELKTEVAHLLCLLAKPEKTDTVLDPFCGYGVIPVELSKNFYTKKILAGDIDPQMANLTRRRARLAKAKITVGRWDALSLKSFPDQSIDKIIADPPWGKRIGKNLDFHDFHRKMLAEFFRVLKQDGLAVIITGQKKSLEYWLKNLSAKFKTLAIFNILVSGQKSAIYQIQKL